MIGNRWYGEGGGDRPRRVEGGRIAATPLIDGDQVDLTAFACGEGDAAERESVRSAIAGDLELAAEFAETLDVLATARELADTVAQQASCVPSADASRGPSPGVSGVPSTRVRWLDKHRGVALAVAARRRLALRGVSFGAGGRRALWAARASVALRVAAVALVWFGISWAVFGEGLGVLFGRPTGASAEQPAGFGRWSAGASFAAAGGGGQGDRALGDLLRPDILPVDDPRFAAAYRELADRPITFEGPIDSPVGTSPSLFRGWVQAENLLAQLRRESMVRFSAVERARVRAATGLADLDDRCAALADEVAARLEVALDAGNPPQGDRPFGDILYGVRGLLAAGSTRHVGPHSEVVRRGAEVLTAAVEAAFGPGTSSERFVRPVTVGEASSALAALAELAVVDGEEVGGFVAARSEELCRQVLTPREDGGRPALLHWNTEGEALADAGRLLRLAPAYGAHAGLAFRARMMIAAHLGERIERAAGSERPELLASQLYGFGDLVDRAAADHRMSVWRLRHLTADYVVVHQFAWSRYPVRSGWAGLQAELRLLAGLPTPDSCAQAGALLLTLCTNVAAPGILDVVAAREHG